MRDRERGSVSAHPLLQGSGQTLHSCGGPQAKSLWASVSQQRLVMGLSCLSRARPQGRFQPLGVEVVSFLSLTSGIRPNQST